jgi:hypothetical protein
MLDAFCVTLSLCILHVHEKFEVNNHEYYYILDLLNNAYMQNYPAAKMIKTANIQRMTENIISMRAKYPSQRRFVRPHDMHAEK